jgi:hypothetical protein
MTSSVPRSISAKVSLAGAIFTIGVRPGLLQDEAAGNPATCKPQGIMFPYPQESAKNKPIKITIQLGACFSEPLSGAV